MLIVAATGGSALNACADFLGDETAVRSLRGKLPPSKPGAFPPFEALVKLKGRGGLPRDAALVICRPPK